MACSVDADIRPDETVVTDSHRSLIKNGKMEIGKESLAYRYLLAIITIERLIDYNGIITDASKKSFKNLQTAGIVKR